MANLFEVAVAPDRFPPHLLCRSIPYIAMGLQVVMFSFSTCPFCIRVRPRNDDSCSCLAAAVVSA